MNHVFWSWAELWQHIKERDRLNIHRLRDAACQGRVKVAGAARGKMSCAASCLGTDWVGSHSVVEDLLLVWTLLPS